MTRDNIIPFRRPAPPRPPVNLLACPLVLSALAPALFMALVQKASEPRK